MFIFHNKYIVSHSLTITPDNYHTNKDQRNRRLTTYTTSEEGREYEGTIEQTKGGRYLSLLGKQGEEFSST